MSEKNGLCSECFNSINFISHPFCYKCGKPFDKEINIKDIHKTLCAKCLKEKNSLFSLQRSAFIYDDESKCLILDFKFKDKTISAETLANMLYIAGKDIWEENPDIIIPVPIHKLRLLKRRYNQSAILAKILGEKTNLKVDYFSLIKHKNTIPQVLLSGSARRNNLRKAFYVKKTQNIKDKNIVLIDDVETTGSTLKECAKLLKKHGAKKIYAITLARTES
ncbi:ComF family protein [bacterium]|nr:ComF family protein [bacterium]